MLTRKISNLINNGYCKITATFKIFFISFKQVVTEEKIKTNAFYYPTINNTQTTVNFKYGLY